MHQAINFQSKPVIGVLHLPPLPGSPGFLSLKESFEDIVEKAVKAARSLDEAGLDGIIVENYGDRPFRVRVKEPETIAALAVIVREVRKSVSVPVGVNVLRNSGVEAYSIAFAAGASFIRVNAYCEPRISPEGFLKPIARSIEAYRSLYSSEIKIFADIDVKHSSPLLPNYNAIEMAQQCLLRAFPDALIVTGSATGSPPAPGYVAAFRGLNIPVIVGSGITPDNISAYWKIADGFIVGTYFKKSVNSYLEVSYEKAVKLMKKVEKLRRDLNVE